MTTPTNLELLAKYLENQIAEHDRSLAAYEKAIQGVRVRRAGLQASLEDLRKALATGTVNGVIQIAKP